MEVRKFDGLSEFAADRKDNDDFENGKYIAAVDVLGRVEQTAAFVQEHNWREAVNKFFDSLTRRVLHRKTARPHSQVLRERSVQ